MNSILNFIIHGTKTELEENNSYYNRNNTYNLGNKFVLHNVIIWEEVACNYF